MTIYKRPDGITLDQAKAWKDALYEIYELDKIDSPGQVNVFKDTTYEKGDLSFKNSQELVDKMEAELGIPKNAPIKDRDLSLTKWIEELQKNPDLENASIEKDDKKEEVTANRPDTESLKGFAEDEARVKAEKEKISQEQKEFTDQEIKLRTQIAEERRTIKERIEKANKIKEESVWVKATPIKTDSNLTEEESIKIIDAKAAANAETGNQKGLEKQLRAEIDRRIGKDIPKEYKDAVLAAASYEMVKSMSGDLSSSPSFQKSAFVAISKSVNVSPEVRDIAGVLANGKLTTRELVESAFSEKVAREVFVEYEIELSKTAKEGFVEVKTKDLVDEYTEGLNNQESFLRDVEENGLENIQISFKTRLGSYLEGKIAGLPEGHFLKSEFATDTFAVFGVGKKVPWEYTGNSMFLKVADMVGFSPTIGWIQARTGINLGFTKAASQAAAIAGKDVVGKAATKGFVSKAITFIGEASGVLDFGISTAITIGLAKLWDKLGPKIKEFINNNKEALMVFGMLSMVFAPSPFKYFLGVPLLVAGSAGVLALGTSGFLLGPLYILRRMLRLVFIEVGWQIFISVVTVVSLTALFLFIINSGAYIVPPKPPDSAFVGGGIMPKCSKEKGEVGIPKSGSSPIANRAWEITFDLYQGFWCFWNRPPKAPAPYNNDFPTDTLVYPPGYPEKFDYPLFFRNPNPGRNGVQNLFWCTWLVVKAYQENGNNIAVNLYTPDMYNDFSSRKKIVAANRVIGTTPTLKQDFEGYKQIVPGSVIFFHVTTGPDRLNHVAVVYSVDPGGITFVQSNSPLKSQSANFKPGGGIGNVGTMQIKYIGLP